MHVYYFVIIIECVSGIIVSLINIPITSNFQKSVPPKMQSRFFSLLAFIGGGLIPLGEFILGQLSKVVDTHIIIGVGGVVMIILTQILLSKREA